jgi:hypothetical protein
MSTHHENKAVNIIGMSKSRRMRWMGHVAGVGKMRSAYIILIAKSKVKGPLGRPRRKWVDIIKRIL